MQSPVRDNIEQFIFRDLSEDLFLGTASDRYAGWLGQIYREENYRGQVSSRKKVVAGKSFQEQTLPVKSVVEYFDHFSFLEVDFTFYRPLRDENLQPTSSFHTLMRYRSFLRPGNRIVLKVPQALCSRRLWIDREYRDNKDYLRPELFIQQFYEPAVAILGDELAGFIFEQEYHSKKERIAPEENIRQLRQFFSSIPRDERYHLELRTPFYFTPAYFDMLESLGIGQVLSHWTWLPSLKEQFSLGGERFFNAGSSCIVRLLTPLRMSYDDTYVMAHPFDRMIEGMMSPSMIKDTLHIVERARERAVRVYITINNRAGGNAPLIARQLSEAFLERESSLETL